MTQWEHISGHEVRSPVCDARVTLTRVARCNKERAQLVVLSMFNIPLVKEHFRWMLRLFRLDGICDLWLNSRTSMATICSVLWQLATRGVEIQYIGNLAVGGVTQTKTKTDIPTQNTHFKSRITGSSIVFCRNKYMNSTCFLNNCKCIMVFYALVQLKITSSTFKQAMHFLGNQQNWMWISTLKELLNSCT